MFYPLVGVCLCLEILENQANEQFPIKACPVCSEKFWSRGILGGMEDVKWRTHEYLVDLACVHVHHLTGNLTCMYTCLCPDPPGICPCMLFRICIALHPPVEGNRSSKNIPHTFWSGRFYLTSLASILDGILTGHVLMVVYCRYWI